MRDLFRRDQERPDKVAALQRMIDEAEESGAGANGMSDVLTLARRKARGGPRAA